MNRIVVKMNYCSPTENQMSEIMSQMHTLFTQSAWKAIDGVLFFFHLKLEQNWNHQSLDYESFIDAIMEMSQILPVENRW